MKHSLKIGATCAMGAPVGSPFPILTDDFFATADWLSSNGLDTMEVHIRTPEQVDGPRLADHCAAVGLGISTIGTGMAYGMEGLSITSTDPAIRRAAVQRLKDQLSLGAICRCPVIIGSMRGTIGPDQTFDEVDRLMVESMKELADFAEKTGTELVIEAINRFETNYLRSADDVLGLIDRVGSSRVLVHLDTYHMNLEESNWRTPILHCGHRLGHVHVADNTRNYPGSGLIDFRTVINTLLEAGYNGSLTMECYPGPDGFASVLNGLRHLAAAMEPKQKAI